MHLSSEFIYVYVPIGYPVVLFGFKKQCFNGNFCLQLRMVDLVLINRSGNLIDSCMVFGCLYVLKEHQNARQQNWNLHF